MNLNDLKHKSLSFATDLQNTVSAVEDPKGAILRRQVLKSGETISSLYLNDQFDKMVFLEDEEKAIKEAMYWVYMLYSIHCISAQVFKTLKTSADHLLKSVSEMMSRNEIE